MGSLFPNNVDYLIFSVNQNHYGVHHDKVISVMDLSKVTNVPHLPPEIRGVIPFRGDNIPLFDLRVSFGAIPRQTETKQLIENMALRKQDHINWLNKLSQEVSDGLPISVQTDPHLCAFGKWYDRFEPDNINLKAHMARFDAPHKQIHKVAVEAKKLVANGQTEAAKKLISHANINILSRLIKLFDEIEGLIHKYLMEYVIVFDTGSQLFAAAVDDINTFCPLDNIEYPLPKGMSGAKRHSLIQAISHNSSQSEEILRSILLLDMDKLLKIHPIVAG
ncbi:MAG: chemotaxis protein CheW [Magnetococcales bacterium]|nr:chemotaxis protein CheW [Magnetococcales bacterium]